MDKLVVDASVTIKWLNPHEPLAAQANAIREDYGHGHVALLVQAFWAYEMVNGVNKAVARGDLTVQEGVGGCGVVAGCAGAHDRPTFATGELRFGPEIPAECLRQLVSGRRGSYRLSILDGGREAV